MLYLWKNTLRISFFLLNNSSCQKGAKTVVPLHTGAQRFFQFSTLAHTSRFVPTIQWSREDKTGSLIINSVHYYSEKWTVWMEKRGKNVACHMTRTKIQNRPHRLEKHNNACLNGKRNYAFHETKPRKTRQITDIFDSEVIKTAATIRWKADMRVWFLKLL